MCYLPTALVKGLIHKENENISENEIWDHFFFPLSNHWGKSRVIFTVKNPEKKKIPETSLAVQWFRLCAPNTEGAQVQFLVGKLTSYMPHGLGKKKKRILLWMNHISLKWVPSWINLEYFFKLKGVDTVNGLLLNSTVATTWYSLFMWILRSLNKFQRPIISLRKTIDYKSVCHQRRECKYSKILEC